MLYAATGSIYFDDIIGVITSSNLTILAFILFFTGLSFKISLVPFHFWTADVYEGAPISVASYLSVISKGAAVFILMILLFTVLKPLIHVWENVVSCCHRCNHLKADKHLKELGWRLRSAPREPSGAAWRVLGTGRADASWLPYLEPFGANEATA